MTEADYEKFLQEIEDVKAFYAKQDGKQNWFWFGLPKLSWWESTVKAVLFFMG
jgi:hypothetical protein